MGIRNVLPGGQGISIKRPGSGSSAAKPASTEKSGGEDSDKKAKTTGAAFGGKSKPPPLTRPAGLGPGPGLVVMKVEGIPEGTLSGSAAEEKKSEKQNFRLVENTMARCWEGYSGEAKLRKELQDDEKRNPKSKNNLSGHMLAVAAILILYVFLMVGMVHGRVQAPPISAPQKAPAPGAAPAPWDQS
jgi:hypothetical protein